MKKIIKLTSISLLALGISSYSFADFDAGLKAYSANDFSTAISEWSPLADGGDASAQYNLGVMYNIGKGVDQDITRAFDLLVKAAEQGDIESQFYLAIMFVDQPVSTAFGIDNEGQDIADSLSATNAHKWITKSAENNNSLAQFSLGLMYSAGLGVTEDKEIAFNWFNKASLNGDSTAQSMLANMHEHGIGTITDIEQAFNWYKKSAENAPTSTDKSLSIINKLRDTDTKSVLFKFYSTDISATHSKIAMMYSKGYGVEINQLEAFNWFTKAAEQGDASSQLYIGNIYSKNNINISIDLDQSAHWYFKAAEQGLVSAQDKLHTLAKSSNKAALDNLQELANGNNIMAQYNLGLMYSEGLGVVSDNETAIEWYTKAARLGDSMSQFSLALMHANNSTETDNADTVNKVAFWHFKAAEQGEPNALKALKKLAKEGDAYAQNNLGMLYTLGKSVKKDKKLAFSLYTNAANKGYAPAQNNLGIKLQFGSGTSKNLADASYWYYSAAEQGYHDALDRLKKLAKSGNVYAQNFLGMMYSSGKAVKKNLVRSVELYKQAAKKGLSVAQYNLGSMYETAQGVTKNLNQATYWYYKSAGQGFTDALDRLQSLVDAGNPDAQNNLAVMYSAGKGVKQNKEMAIKLYILAAEQGLATAQKNLGMKFEQGDGIASNLERAAFWYTKSAKQGYKSGLNKLALLADKGSVDAQNNLAIMYSVGSGVKQNKKMAARLYKKAAMQGYAPAQNNLGIKLEYGEGVSKNINKASAWYFKAAKQGYKNALESLERLGNTGTSLAQYNLGLIYEKGAGVTANDTHAVHWYRMGAEQGDIKAQKKFNKLLTSLSKSSNLNDIDSRHVLAVSAFKAAWPTATYVSSDIIEFNKIDKFAHMKFSGQSRWGNTISFELKIVFDNDLKLSNINVLSYNGFKKPFFLINDATRDALAKVIHSIGDMLKSDNSVK